MPPAWSEPSLVRPKAVRSSPVHRWVVALGLCGVVAWLIWRWHSGGGFQGKQFIETWTSANWGWLTASTVCYLAAYWARAERWRVMLQPLRPFPAKGAIFSATAIGFAAVMLMGRPGELVRPYLISIKENTPLSTQMAIWVLERIFDVLLLLTLFGGAVALMAGRTIHGGGAVKWMIQTGGLLAAAIACGCVALLTVLAVWGPHLREKLSPILGWLGDDRKELVLRLVETATNGLASIRQPSLLARALGWSVFHWFVVCICFITALRAFPATADRSWADALVLMAFSAFGSVVQIPGIGGGPQVACTMVLVELFHLPLETAAGMALVIYLVGFMAIVPLGLVLLAKRGLSLTGLRHLREDVSA